MRPDSSTCCNGARCEVPHAVNEDLLLMIVTDRIQRLETDP